MVETFSTSAPNMRLWTRQWSILTAVAALLATAFDAALLQRERNFFSFLGGFLSVDHLRHPAEAVLFTAASLLSDAAVVGPLVAFGLWISLRAHLGTGARHFTVLAIALSPLVVTDFISYQLLTYLGDGFDFLLMFELTGWSPSEILAVTAAHLVAPVLVLCAGGALLGAVAWVLYRRRSATHTEHRLVPPRPSRTLLLPAVLLVAALLTTSALRVTNTAFDSGLRRKPSGKLLGAIATFLSDVDRDGYGLLSRPPDPDAWEARVFPYAVDIPGNGIDEDGVAGDLPLTVPVYTDEIGELTRWRSTPHVVLIVLESFRADIVGAMVNGVAVTPVLDDLASRGISARFAFSHNGYTTQSRYHMFSGRLVKSHQTTTLIDDFQTNGYEVAFFSAQDESFGSSELDVGFERADVAYDARVDRNRRYSTYATPASLAVPFGVLQERIGSFLRSRSATRPLFLYVNFHDTHFPYHHSGVRPLVSNRVLAQRDIRPQRAAALWDMYLNTAANVDRAIGHVLDATRHVLGEEPAVIVTADHGESLFDKGFLGHGYALNDVQTRIPLIAANLPIVIEEPFGQVSLRHAIRAALEREPGSPPVVKLRHGRVVFQYLGRLERPKQISLTGTSKRTIYDFRTGLFRSRAGRWRHPDELGPEEVQDFLQLVWRWESMLVRGQSLLNPSL